MQVLAPAKINLALHVIGKRPAGDAKAGYHELDSLVAFADIGDQLAAEVDETLSLTITGPFAAQLQGDSDNLVFKAARWLLQRHGLKHGARLTLTKNLPVASGVGGGSADAAAALRLLSDLWQVPLPASAAETLALGADVPVCLASRPCRMQGIGERLTGTPPLPQMGVLLVNPGQALATPPVFAARQGAFCQAIAWPRQWPSSAAAFVSWLAAQRNDLERPAISLCPAIAEILSALGRMPEVELARMSGSGATCFALTKDRQTADRLAGVLRGRHPAWWIASGAFLDTARLG